VYIVCSAYRALVLNEEQTMALNPNAAASSMSEEVSVEESVEDQSGS
jgi:hypothetical protein